jgi:plasmid stabilization system protein ParE
LILHHDLDVASEQDQESHETIQRKARELAAFERGDVGRAPRQGAKWFNGLEQAVLSLDAHPKRCPVAPESIDPDQPVRVLSYGRKPHVYRVFFTVDDETKAVRVVHVRRGARRRPIAEELRGE